MIFPFPSSVSTVWVVVAVSVRWLISFMAQNISFRSPFFPIIHRGDFLWIIQVGGSFHGIDRQHFGPEGTGTGQFQAVMCGAALNFSQLALVFLVDLPDNGGYGLALAAVLPRKEDAKGRATIRPIKQIITMARMATHPPAAIAVTSALRDASRAFAAAKRPLRWFFAAAAAYFAVMRASWAVAFAVFGSSLPFSEPPY